MLTTLWDLKQKDVINIRDGTKLGQVGDVEIDTKQCRVISIIILGRLRLFGLLGRTEDIVIRWENVNVIGNDTILVNYDIPVRNRNRNVLFNFEE